MRMNSHFRINGFTASLALKKRFGATRKEPIFQTFSGVVSTKNQDHPRPPKEGDPCSVTKYGYAVEKTHPLPASHLESCVIC